MPKLFRALPSIALAGATCAALIAPPPAYAAAQHRGHGTETVTYTPTSATIANPERGFYHHPGNCDDTDFSVDELRAYRTNENISLVMCMFYLKDVKTRPIGQATLLHLQRQFDAVRAAGLKMILRFAYTEAEDGADATKDQVLAHLDQLAPYLKANSDVIYVMQAGFVGAWGEWYYTQNFGNEGNLTEADWANRKAVVDELLDILPKTRTVQLRTPAFKRTLYGTRPLSPRTAHDGSARSRIGHHNDCFLAGPDDYGTYQDSSVEYPYLAADTSYVPMGGETCNPNPPRSDCPTALTEMALFHWSFINADYQPDVLGSWTTGACRTEITNRLGYRFTLTKGTYPNRAKPGHHMRIRFTVKNDGWAPPINPRAAELVLRNTRTGATHHLPLRTDPRRWAPGTTTTVHQNLSLPPDLPTGTYDLFLNLPDPALPSTPAYSIRLANEGTWNPTTGLNNLLHRVTVR